MSQEQPDFFGLSARDIETIKSTLQSYPEVREVKIFGSRAKGTYKAGSDIDLCIMNEISDLILARLKSDLADSTLPYTVDLISYASLHNNDLKGHIDRIGADFYKKIH